MLTIQALYLLLAAALLMAGSMSTADAGDHESQVESRKLRFLADRVDWWRGAGYPSVQHEGQEWKFDEIEPCWAGAHAALLLKRNAEETDKANLFFAHAPIDWDCDPDMRVCELLHSYYAFKDDPQFTAPAKQRILQILETKEPPRRLYPSVWDFHATENHAMMGHVWLLLYSQIKGDEDEVAAVGKHIAERIREHARRGWHEFYSPCYVEKEMGCMVLLREWADNPELRRLGDLMLDLLLAEHAVLNIDGVMGGPCRRAYGYEPIGSDGEMNHNSQRDRMRSGIYSAAYIAFGDAQPHFYGVLGSMCLASSGYVPPGLITRLALAREKRGTYEFRARKPGDRMHSRLPEGKKHPEDADFNGRVYCYATPDFILGSTQQVEGVYEVTHGRNTTIYTALILPGSTRKMIYFECGQEGINVFQHKNVVTGRGDTVRAYVASDELGEVSETGGLIFVNDASAFIALRSANGDYTWEDVDSPSVFGRYLKFGDPKSLFIMEVARPADYASFEAFKRDIMDSRVSLSDTGVLTYESCSAGISGASSESFTIQCKPGAVPKVDGSPVDLASYPAIASPYVRSEWNSGIVKINFGEQTLTLDFNKTERISGEDN